MADLITLQQYKDFAGLSGIQEDAKINVIIPAVSQAVKTYCGTTIIDFYSTDKTETFDILYHEDFVQLTESPVRTDETITVSERTSESGSYSTLTENTDYFVDTKTDSIIRLKKAFPAGRGSVQVVYKAGYSSTPEDLKLAVIDLVTYYHKDEYKQRQTLSGATIQNSSTSSQRGNPGLPDHIKRVLDMYKNF